MKKKLKGIDSCTGCEACVNACPTAAITMKIDNKNTFLYPSINDDMCINCGKCENVCNNIVGKMVDDLQVYGAVNNDFAVRHNSTSGGIFPLLANYVLDMGGVVFGASFSEQFDSVETIEIEDRSDVCKLQGSKYLQSRIGDAYKKVKSYLENGRYVLFTGTPCQVAGLLSFLGKRYDTLYTQDILCHGVPSQVMWSKYLSFKKRKKAIRSVQFRTKDVSWQDPVFKIVYEDGSVYAVPTSREPYMLGFFKDMTLRNSCYNCQFKNVSALPSDITIADFWGIESVAPTLDDKQGVSLVLCRGEKGRMLMDCLKNSCSVVEVDKGKAIAQNNQAERPPHMHPQRHAFLECLHTNTRKAFSKYCDFDRVTKIKMFIKHRMIKK